MNFGGHPGRHCDIPCHQFQCVNGCVNARSAYRSPRLGEPHQSPFQPAYPQAQQGCICPPTSEQTCESKTCPRKDHSGEAA